MDYYTYEVELKDGEGHTRSVVKRAESCIIALNRVHQEFGREWDVVKCELKEID